MPCHRTRSGPDSSNWPCSWGWPMRPDRDGGPLPPRSRVPDDPRSPRRTYGCRTVRNSCLDRTHFPDIRQWRVDHGGHCDDEQHMAAYRPASCSGSDGIEEVPEGGWTTASRPRRTPWSDWWPPPGSTWTSCRRCHGRSTASAGAGRGGSDRDCGGWSRRRRWRRCFPPLHLEWSVPGRLVDLSDRRQRARLYEVVL